MSLKSRLLPGPVHVAALGATLFADEVERQGTSVERLEWVPPVPGTEHALNRLARRSAEIAAANDQAVARMQEAHPALVGLAAARDMIPEMDERTLLHAGPPIEWPDMCGPLRGAIVGAVLHEGLAGTVEAAEEMAESGALTFASCHERSAVGPMAGVIGPSMPVWIVENLAVGNRAVATINEGLGKVLRYGAFDEEVLGRLAWIRDSLAPTLSAALASRADPIDLRSLIAQALQMGDEGHNRNRAATSLMLRELAPALFRADVPSTDAAEALAFIAGNDHFTLNLTMPACKVTADAATSTPRSSIVTAMARNGTEFGIRLAGTGDRWFVGPAPAVDGLYFPGYGPEDANPDIGDSTITETVGLGGFAMAAAPAIVGFVGGTPEDAIGTTRSMYEITWDESRSYSIPALGFRGTPLGIDVREVVHTRVLPAVNTGIAHRDAGVGQIGAGLVYPPEQAFVAAVIGLAEAM